VPKTRLDQLLVDRGLADSRTRAQALILAGEVRVNGNLHSKPGTSVDAASEISLAATLPFVSRGGYKLAHALDTFPLDPSGLVALDVGASTGGFTDVLLQRGAALVYAVDVGYGILDWRLRQDARVVVLERTNIRHLQKLPPADADTRTSTSDVVLAQCATIDASFISLRIVLPATQRLLAPDAWLVVLVKPQFEAGPQQVGKGGVVRDPAVHRRVLRDVLNSAADMGLHLYGLTRSPITGPAGNIEFLAWLQCATIDAPPLEVEQAVQQATAPAP
jgi:23S rRNA (cytidine1920-2'-O)/16S rRNA (cytidine1409-2'-O)-methyltransferase